MSETQVPPEPDADVDLGRGADVLHRVRAALGEEPQVAVELDLLQRHRAAGQRPPGVGRGEEAEPLTLQQLGDLAGLVVVMPAPSRSRMHPRRMP